VTKRKNKLVLSKTEKSYIEEGFLKVFVYLQTWHFREVIKLSVWSIVIVKQQQLGFALELNLNLNGY
jgi:hypothetical protein